MKAKSLDSSNRLWKSAVTCDASLVRGNGVLWQIDRTQQEENLAQADYKVADKSPQGSLQQTSGHRKYINGTVIVWASTSKYSHSRGKQFWQSMKNKLFLGWFMGQNPGVRKYQEGDATASSYHSEKNPGLGVRTPVSSPALPRGRRLLQ